MRKLGSLFSGIGGFELAWVRNGGEVAWMCEIDKKARKVLEARFPGVPIYEDVEQLDPYEVEAVDVLSGGSPCQGFSVAGMRTGLNHGESRLFADYVRIMEGLADRGLQWAVWENVPGVLSIKNPDGERTFPHVIGALVGADGPVELDPKRKWNVGVASRPGREVAWRVVDSRHFGVPQRRRRVYACVALGHPDEGAAGRALLAVTEGLPGDPATCQQAGKDAAKRAAKRAGGKGVAGPGGVGAEAFRMAAFGDYSDDGTASTVKARDYKDATDLVVPVGAEPMAFNWQSGGDARGLEPTEQTSALTTSQTPAVLLGVVHPPVVPIQDTRAIEKAQGGLGVGEEGDPSYTLDTASRAGVGPVAFRKSKRAQSAEDDETWVEDGNANTLNVFDAGDTRTTHAILEPVAFSVREDAKAGNFSANEVDVAGALQATQASPSSHHAQTYVADVVAFTQNQREEVRVLGDEVGALSASGGSHQTNYLMQQALPDKVGPITAGGMSSTRGTETTDSNHVLIDVVTMNGDTVSAPLIAGDTTATGTIQDAKVMAVREREVESLTPWPEMPESMRVYGTSQSSPALTTSVKNIMSELPESFDEMNFTTDPDVHHSLRAGTRQSTGVVEPYGFSAGNSANARSLGEAEGISPPLRAAASGTNQTPTVGPVPIGDEQTVDFGRTSDRIRINADTAATLQAGGGGVGAKTGLYMTAYGVRRLTPVECERLQAFPDGWTEPSGSDSARYKALGNAITVNVAQWVFRRILEES